MFPGAGGRHEWQDGRVLLRRYSGLAAWGLGRGWGFPLLEIFDVALGFQGLWKILRAGFFFGIIGNLLFSLPIG